MKNSAGKALAIPLFGAIAVALIMAVLVYFLKSKPEEKRPTPPTVVVTTKVTQATVPFYLTGIGHVQALQSITIRPQIEGTLTRVYFTEGATVKAGDLLATLDERTIVANLAQAKAEKTRNEALLASAQSDYDRYQELVAESAISAQTLQQQKAQVAQLSAALQANNATITAHEVQLSHTRITSPITGRVGLRQIDAGNVVTRNDSLVSVTQVNPISVVFTLPQQHLATVQSRLNSAQNSVTVLDRAQGNTLAIGTLKTMDNHIDSASGTVRIKALFANDKSQLWPGQFVSIKLESERFENALTLPSKAIQRGRDGNFVYIVKDGIAQVQAITLRAENEHIAIIKAGISPDAEVVIDGHSRLKPGAQVKVANTVVTQ